MKENDEDKLLIAKVMDKYRFCETRNKPQTTDFLDVRNQKIVEKILKSKGIRNYLITGGYEEAERKVILFYPEKLEDLLDNINLDEYIKIIRITLPQELKGEYNHRNYLGGLMKLGITREKIGDILVDEIGADILVLPETLKFLINNIL